MIPSNPNIKRRDTETIEISLKENLKGEINTVCSTTLFFTNLNRITFDRLQKQNY